MIGSQTPLVGRELLPEDQRPPEITTPPQLPAAQITEPRVLDSITPDQKAPSAPATISPQGKKQKTWGPAVLKFKDQKDLPLHGVITIIKDKPKRDKAAWRYSFYRNGMTVQQYIDVMGQNKIGPAKAKQDVRWDYSKGFIAVEPSS